MSTIRGEVHAPYYAIYNVGDYTFSPWKVIWAEQGKFSSAVIGTETVPMARARPFVPDHKIFFADFGEKAPAYYLCGLLNSDIVKEFVESHNISIQIGDIFKHMSLPQFDPDNKMHAQLAVLVEKTHQAKNGDYEGLLGKVRQLAERILE